MYGATGSFWIVENKMNDPSFNGKEDKMSLYIAVHTPQEMPRGK
jgi:hypothetical protein